MDQGGARLKAHCMNQDLEHLIVLQALDLDLRRLRAELADAPARVRTAETARGQAEAALARLKQSLAKEEALRRSQESDAATHREKLVKLRRQLDAATSTAQVTALEHEIRFAEEAISKLEDEELASLERTELQEAERGGAEQALEAKSSILEEERSHAAELTERNNASIAELEAERSALRAEIAAADSGERALSNYDRVAKAKGTGVSEAVDHKCAACQMMVRPQRWNDLTGHEHDDTIFTCETCGRMLFWDPRRDKPGAWAAGERLGAAVKKETGSRK